MVATLCALANEIVVMPAALTWQTDEQHKTTNYAFGFAIPTNTPGLKFICRPPVAHLDAASPMDGPLSLQDTMSQMGSPSLMMSWYRGSGCFCSGTKKQKPSLEERLGLDPMPYINRL